MNVEEIQQTISNEIENKTNLNLNRAQRRALMKKAGKKGRAQFGLVNDTAKKLDYINLIQKIRELKEKNKDEVINDE